MINLINRFAELKDNSSISSYLYIDKDIKRELFSKHIKISFIRNYTIELMMPVIRCEIARSGVYPEVFVCDYDSVMQEAVDSKSALYASSPDYICVALSLRNLAPKIAFEHGCMEADELKIERERVISFIESLASALNAHSNATVLWQTFVLEASPAFGMLDAQLDVSESDTIFAINSTVRAVARRYGGYVIDIERMAYRYGCASLIDERSWYSSKNPYSKTALVSIGREYGRAFRVLLGGVKKCVVLDCDNTLWGGIVGEDGVTGIKLGDGYPGSCFSALQREIKNLIARGVIVALCSKNNEEDVLEVFNANKDMTLKLDDIAVYEINWKSKAENMISIAKRLNIGLDSIVFVDDSEMECSLVADALPEIEVIHLKGDPSGFAGTIRDCGCFASLRLTSDDAMRSNTYKANAAREQIMRKFSNVENYLESLHMKARICVNDIALVDRIAQMTQKTNQFNLTTQRYTEKEILSFIEDKSYDVLAISLQDDVSDMGVIGLIILYYCEREAEINTFLLSCRALSRHVEDALFASALNIAFDRECATIKGSYIPTKKNSQVAELYKRLGLTLISKNQDGTTLWMGKCEHREYPAFIDVI